MNILNTIDAWQNWRNAISHEKSVGIVPTMGALHDGHRSLITRCRRENDICVVSIFVNPTQFNDPNDLNNYPVTFDEDRNLCAAEGVDAIFMPQYADLYPDDYRYRVMENRDSQLLCGAHRPGHFDGMLSVVMKLFNLARPSGPISVRRTGSNFSWSRAWWKRSSCRSPSCPAPPYARPISWP